MSPSPPGWLLIASLVALVGLGLRRAQRWRIGKPAPVAVLAGLLAAPRRYLVQVHEAVARAPLARGGPHDTGRHAALMHILSAGGLVLSILLIVLVHVTGIAELAWPLLIALALLAAGAALVALRRRPRPARLSGAAFERLPIRLLVFAVFFAVATLPAARLTAPIPWFSALGFALLAISAWASFAVIAGLAQGPLKHALAGFLHLAWHPRPARFAAGAIDSGLHPLALDAPKLGIETRRDFAWNQLLAFDACVQCGRCEAACPAFAAGLPLNPKKLIQDLTGADHYAGNPHPGLAVAIAPSSAERPLVGTDAAIHPDTLWACTTCRACVYECPMLIEHVDAIIDLRRFQTLAKGALPGKAPAALLELRGADTVSGKAPAARLDWAVDLDLPILADKRECDVLLWIGEGGFDLRHQRVLRAIAKLLRAASIDFAVLGAEELDCGDLARRLGDEATFQDLARRNIATLARYRFARILTADPHVLHVIKNEYPAFGGQFTVVHHSTLFAELLQTGRLGAAKATSAAPITFHDPCYLGRYNGEIDAPRAILAQLGLPVVEMAQSGLRSSCCGWGGGAAFTDVPGKRRIPDVRMAHIRAAGAATVAVACPNCALMLEGVVQPRAAVADLAELVLEALDVPP